MKTIYEKPKANIIVNSQNLKTFILKSRTKQGSLLLPLLFNIIIDTIAKAVKINKSHLNKK